MTETKNDSNSTKNWLEQKNKLKSKLTGISDLDLQFDENNKAEMFTGLKKKTGKTQEELEKIMASN